MIDKMIKAVMMGTLQGAAFEAARRAVSYKDDTAWWILRYHERLIDRVVI